MRLESLTATPMQQTTWSGIKWFSLAVSIGSIVLAVVLMQESGSEQPSESSTATNEEPKTQVESPVIVERKDGNITWTLRAQEANQQLDGKMRLNKPVLVLYTDTQQEIHIVSKLAWFNPLTRNLRFKDQVLVRYQQWSISTDLMTYNSASDELHMPNSFKLWGDSITARGKNMHLQRNSEQVTVDDGIWIEDSDPHWQGVTQ